MALRPLAGFRHFTTDHCITGSLRHVYAFHGHDLSEDLLLGIGSGVGFIYWHQRGGVPFLGGRWEDRATGFEVLAGQRTGVQVTAQTTTSPRRAEAALVDLLARGEPVWLQVDMGFLPYFDLGGGHFGGHAVVACGHDPAAGTVLLADRDADLHPVPLADLAQARGSTFQPFPPHHRWLTFDFAGQRRPTAGEVTTAIRAQAATMLTPPLRNFGVAGIRKAAQAVRRWPSTLEPELLRPALINMAIMLSAEGGTGGGLFRYMFARFLAEAAELTGQRAYADQAERFRISGDGWEALADLARAASQAADPADCLAEIAAGLEAQAGLEQTAWQGLAAVARD